MLPYRRLNQIKTKTVEKFTSREESNEKSYNNESKWKILEIFSPIMFIHMVKELFAI